MAWSACDDATGEEREASRRARLRLPSSCRVCRACCRPCWSWAAPAFGTFREASTETRLCSARTARQSPSRAVVAVVAVRAGHAGVSVITTIALPSAPHRGGEPRGGVQSSAAYVCIPRRQARAAVPASYEPAGAQQPNAPSITLRADRRADCTAIPGIETASRAK